MPQEYYYIHLIANLVAGLSFWGVSYYFNVFIKKVKINVDRDKIPDHYDGDLSTQSEIWIQVHKLNYLFTTISFVFFFCGLGHILEAFVPWSEIFAHIILVHNCTAALGALLVFSLYRVLNSTPDKD